MVFVRSFFVMTVATLPACGGKVTVDQVGGTGGAGGASTSSTSTTSGSTSIATTSGVTGTSSSTSSTGAGGPCPSPLPPLGSPCTGTSGVTCDVPYLCCPAAAHCKGGIWQINSLGPCAPDACAQIPCGDGLGCAPGAVCVADNGPVVTFECRPNPCEITIDCACAGSYCAEQGLACAGVKGTTVICQ